VGLATEGRDQVVTRSATLHSGKKVWASAKVSIDWTSPTVIVGSPIDGSTTEAQAISMTASVEDGLSGPSLATCNLADAAIVERSVTCTVPLARGRNALIVQASDTAGNSASASVHVLQSTVVEGISASPSKLTVTVKGESRLDVRDDHGRVVNAHWSSSEPAIAEVLSERGIPTVFGRSQGEAILTAVQGGLSTNVKVVVVDSSLRPPDDPFLFPPGATLWSVPGAKSEVIEAVKSESAGPDLFLLDPGAGMGTLRSLSHAGFELARETVPYFPADQVVGDAFDGIVCVQSSARVTEGMSSRRGGTLMRVGGRRTRAWVLASDRPFCSAVAQGSNNVLAVVECSWRDGPASFAGTEALNVRPGWLLRIDGLNGKVLSRTELPMIRRCVGAQCELSPVVHGSPTEAIDGSIYLLHTSGQLDSRTDRARSSARYTLQLLRITSDGAHTYRDLARSGDVDGATSRNWPTRLVANGDGRLLGVSLGAPGAPVWVIDDDSIALMPVGTSASIESVVIHHDQTLMGTRERRSDGVDVHFTTSYDAETLKQRWRAAGSPIVPADGGAIVSEGSDGTLSVIDANGEQAGSWVVPRVTFWDADVWLREEEDELSAVSGPSGERALFTLR
jgi:hypothetical protein